MIGFENQVGEVSMGRRGYRWFVLRLEGYLKDEVENGWVGSERRHEEVLNASVFGL